MGEPIGPGGTKSKTRLKLVRRSPVHHGFEALSPVPSALRVPVFGGDFAAELLDEHGPRGAMRDHGDDGCLISSPDTVISRRLQEQTRIVLATLTPREQLVLRLRFGIALTGGQPLEKIDDVLTPDQMSFIEATALRKFRHPSQGVRLRSVDRR